MMNIREFSILLLVLPIILASAQECKVEKKVSPVDTLVFEKIGGNYFGGDGCGRKYNKELYIPRFFKAYWHQAKSICEAYNLEIASFETEKEAKHAIEALQGKVSEINEHFYVGGVTASMQGSNAWYWLNSGNKISYNLPWNAGQPDQEAKEGLGKQKCLALSLHEGKLGFNDVFCIPSGTGSRDKFVCQYDWSFEIGRKSDLPQLQDEAEEEDNNDDYFWHDGADTEENPIDIDEADYN